MLSKRIIRSINKIITRGQLNASPVILRWRERAGPVAIPGIESASDPAITQRSLTVNALVHYTGIGTTDRPRFLQIEKGDVILDFTGDAPLDGKEDLKFEIGNRLYVQKDTGSTLAQTWDVRCGGIPVTRTVLVTPVS